MWRSIAPTARYVARAFGEARPRQAGRVGVLITVALAIVGAAQATTGRVLTNAVGASQARIAYKDGLKNPYRFRMRGQKKADGSCAYSPPDLVLAPAEKAIEARQV